MWILFGIYFVCYALICIFSQDQSLNWILLSAFSFVLSVLLLIKYRFPEKKKFILPAIFTAIYMISQIFNFGIFSVIQGILVFIATTACITVFTNEECGLPWIRNQKKSSVLISIGIGILAGVVWGIVNLLLMKGNYEVTESNILFAFVYALNPAVVEEIAYRTVFYAFCLSLCKGKIQTKGQLFTVYFMMIVPHVLPHLMFAYVDGILFGLASWLVNLILYIVIFGVLFAVLQKKRDVASAMIAHSIVDFIRFCFFGLPL